MTTARFSFFARFWSVSSSVSDSAASAETGPRSDGMIRNEAGEGGGAPEGEGRALGGAIGVYSGIVVSRRTPGGMSVGARVGMGVGATDAGVATIDDSDGPGIGTPATVGLSMIAALGASPGSVSSAPSEESGSLT